MSSWTDEEYCANCGDPVCPGSCRAAPGTYLVVGGFAVLVLLAILAYISYKL
jgi:hypothetical protein